jgi:Phosphoesterase family
MTSARSAAREALNDVRKGQLPQVSWIIPSFARGWDEHPPADISVGMGIQEELITALRESSAWESSAYIITYYEHGGYFEHVPPPQVDEFGLGIRIPTWVISPYAKKSHLEPTVYQLTTTLKFLERLHGLPTLASVNHLFDEATPAGPNYKAAGRPADRPAGAPARRPHRHRRSLRLLRLLGGASRSVPVEQPLVRGGPRVARPNGMDDRRYLDSGPLRGRPGRTRPSTTATHGEGAVRRPAVTDH